jgi:hypothetical protein
MNKRMMKRWGVLADTIAAADESKFDMSNWFTAADEFGEDAAVGRGSLNECGTVGCLAGWAVSTFTKKSVKTFNVKVKASDLLGLNRGQANNVFVNHNYWAAEFPTLNKNCFSNPQLDDVTKRQAVAMCRSIANGKRVIPDKWVNSSGVEVTS